MKPSTLDPDILCANKDGEEPANDNASDCTRYQCEAPKRFAGADLTCRSHPRCARRCGRSRQCGLCWGPCRGRLLRLACRGRAARCTSSGRACWRFDDFRQIQCESTKAPVYVHRNCGIFSRRGGLRTTNSPYNFLRLVRIRLKSFFKTKSQWVEKEVWLYSQAS